MIELNDYKDKLFIKWKVLKDINKKTFLSNNKRYAINERINSIINELVIVNSNMNAISLEISTYLNLIDASNIKIIDNTDKFLTKRYNMLKEYLRLFDISCNSENVNIESIVYMEILLEKYFATYPKIKSYLDGEVEKAKTDGYSLTMFGRRRPVPELKSSNFMQRSFGERVAMNAPIQGTAADIIKIAMIHVNEELKKRNLKSRMILQVHDELLIEADETELEEVQQILQDKMEHAAELLVPLSVDMHTGKNWYEAK